MVTLLRSQVQAKLCNIFASVFLRKKFDFKKQWEKEFPHYLIE